jgi:chemotaxis regulatin CheY-phosphate phosphatase CheZ
MLQLNDTSHTLIDLTKNNLIGIEYRSLEEVTVKFRLDEVVVETTFTYETIADARDDYQMLIDMVSDGSTLLQEGVQAYCDLNAFVKNL